MFHYERKPHDFKQGEVLHNFNGTDYLVLECYSKNNLLLMNLASGSFLVGVNTAYYERYPMNDGGEGKAFETGIEWGRGHYLGDRLSEIGQTALRAEYCEPYERRGSSFPIEIREILSRVVTVEAETLGDAIDKTAGMYGNEEIVLGADDFAAVLYLPEKGDA